MTLKTNKFSFLLYLTGLSVIGFLATDMYLPAFDQMRVDLDTTKTNISASLSLFLGGYALGQLFWGPVADKIGKYKTITIGLSIFTISSLLIYFTPYVSLLMLLRLVQAFGVCAAAVSWQALVIDHYPIDEVNKVFATIMPLVALSPALAPLLGVVMLEQFGWRSIFITLAICSIILTLHSLVLNRQNKTQITDSKASEVSDTISYFSIIKNKTYLGNVIIYAMCSGAFFAWLTGSPFFLKELGYNEKEIGLSFIPQTIAFLVGGYGLRYLSSKIDTVKLVPYLLWLYAISVASLLVLTLTTTPTLLTLLIPFCMMALANGACYPIVVAEALTPFRNNSGKAAALQNALQLGVCFITSAIVSVYSNNALLATTSVMASTIVFMYIAYKLCTRAKK